MDGTKGQMDCFCETVDLNGHLIKTWPQNQPRSLRAPPKRKLSPRVLLHFSSTSSRRQSQYTHPSSATLPLFPESRKKRILSAEHDSRKMLISGLRRVTLETVELWTHYAPNLDMCERPCRQLRFRSLFTQCSFYYFRGPETNLGTPRSYLI